MCGCRWGGAASNAAELKAKPTVAKADKAVNSATDSQQQAPDASKHGMANPAGVPIKSTSRQPSNLNANSLQQRPTGQNSKSGMPS